MQRAGHGRRRRDYRPKTHQIDSKLKRQATGLRSTWRPHRTCSRVSPNADERTNRLSGLPLNLANDCSSQPATSSSRVSTSSSPTRLRPWTPSRSRRHCSRTRERPRTVQLTSKAEFAGLLLSVIEIWPRRVPLARLSNNPPCLSPAPPPIAGRSLDGGGRSSSPAHDARRRTSRPAEPQSRNPCTTRTARTTGLPGPRRTDRA